MAADEILVIDDDVELCDLLRTYLGQEGFAIRTAHDGPSGLERASGSGIGLVILDVMLPGLSGFDVLRRLREVSPVPVLMLTARGDDVDRIVGLEMGADDYLAKPFNPRELVARIRAILRRAERTAGGSGADGEPDAITVGDVELQRSARVVRRGGVEVPLTGMEFALLEVLLENAGRVVSRDELTQRAMGRPYSAYDRSIDVHVSNLRRKLGGRPGNAERIKAVRGTGYVYTVG